jgi:hypothetical protein
MVITDPLAHSPPANNPWINLKKIRSIGANMPTVCQVGSKPVAKVTIENPTIVTIMVFFCRIYLQNFQTGHLR